MSHSFSFTFASRRALQLSLAALALCGAARATMAQEAGIAVGASAPGAAVESLEGKAMDLAEFIGKKPVVLEFWATWCPLCRKLESPMQAAREKYGSRVTFISVGVKDNQTPEKQKAYSAEKHIGGQFVFDRDGKAVAAYKVPHTSYLVVIGADGKVAYTGVGAEQDIETAVAKAVR